MDHFVVIIAQTNTGSPADEYIRKAVRHQQPRRNCLPKYIIGRGDDWFMSCTRIARRLQEDSCAGAPHKLHNSCRGGKHFTTAFCATFRARTTNHANDLASRTVSFGKVIRVLASCPRMRVPVDVGTNILLGDSSQSRNRSAPRRGVAGQSMTEQVFGRTDECKQRLSFTVPTVGFMFGLHLHVSNVVFTTCAVCALALPRCALPPRPRAGLRIFPFQKSH